MYYTPQDDYGAVCYPDGEVAAFIRYLAICKYDEDDLCYLFCCDENYEVVSDWLHTSIQECMAAAERRKEPMTWIRV